MLTRSFTFVVKELCVLQINELGSGCPFCFNSNMFAFGRYLIIHCCFSFTCSRWLVKKLKSERLKQWVCTCCVWLSLLPLDGLWVVVYGQCFFSSLCLAQRNAQNEIHLKNLKPARKMEYYVNRAIVLKYRNVLSANFVQTFTDGIIVGLIKCRWCTISRRWSCFIAVWIIIDIFDGCYSRHCKAACLVWNYFNQHCTVQVELSIVHRN